MAERPILFSAPMVQALLAGRKTQTRRTVKPRSRVSLFAVEEDGTPQWTDSYVLDPGNAEWRMRDNPYGVPGDRLWVREGFLHAPPGIGFDLTHGANGTVGYIADGPGEWSDRALAGGAKRRPSIHMPHWASRITLEVTDVRVERLQDISEADAIAEGLYRNLPDDEDRAWYQDHCEERGKEPDWVDFNAGVWMAPGVRQGWGLTKEERARDQWAPTPQFAYRLVWESINGAGSWDANPWVWAVSFKVLDQAALPDRSARKAVA